VKISTSGKLEMNLFFETAVAGSEVTFKVIGVYT